MGILLYEMLHQVTPFKAANLYEQKRKMERGRILIKRGVNKDLKRTIKACLKQDPSKRPTASQILEFKIFRASKKKTKKE